MSETIVQAKRVLALEAQAVAALANRIGEDFEKAVRILCNCKGRVVATGIGKSGIIARKIASTLSSTGTPSFYLHPAESSHGDLGMVTDQDVILALSYRGEAEELTPILTYAARRNLPIISLTGNLKSRLAQASEVVIDVSVGSEACPLNLAPTASTTATLAMGDALAMAVLVQKGFSPEDFAEFHPGGSLGRRMLRVRDIMHADKAMPLVIEDSPMKLVLSVMTAKEVRGVAGVVDKQGDLLGVITDGDLRRRLEKSLDPLAGVARDIMNLNPKIIDADELVEKAAFVMEQFQIQLLFVTEKNSSSNKKPVGVINYQDVFRVSRGETNQPVS